MKRIGDRGSSARGGLGGKRRPEPEDAGGDDDEAEAPPPVKKGSGRSSGRAAEKGDTARRKRTSARGGGGGGAAEAASPLKKAMFIGTPIMAIIFIILLVVVSSKEPEKPKIEKIDYTKDAAAAGKLRMEAQREIQDAKKISIDDADRKRPLLIDARKKLVEANELLDKVRQNSPDTGPDKKYDFEDEQQRINECMKQCRDDLKEIGG